ncbi:PREDICTED: uncharacterized protein LOC104806220 [Tarenaya hassleriana]|uniref:uncharacterized protein LOC104806220 n=1 Tax=Tarenaya hassleriana TaxID=28532 RepID=UPI00053C757B|nr:PREDICTED: uncharacterized protein LOC104806220 [Tarenaya hassleriana]
MNRNSSGDEWLQYFEQQVQEMGRSVNALDMTSSSESFTVCHVAAPENAGRRPRTSRRAKPTTLLNANPSNFRAIVQQFTGCSSAGENSVRRRGPVTLNFGSPSSVSEEDVFPRSGDGGYQRNYDNALHGSWPPRREENGAGGKGRASYGMAHESGLMSHGSSDDHHHHDHHHDDGVTREYSGNTSSDMYIDYDDISQGELFDTTMFQEFTKGDIDRMLD